MVHRRRLQLVEAVHRFLDLPLDQTQVEGRLAAGEKGGKQCRQ